MHTQTPSVKTSEPDGSDGFVGQGLSKSPFQEMKEDAHQSNIIIMGQDYRIKELSQALQNQVRRADEAYDLLARVHCTEVLHDHKLWKDILDHLAMWEGSA